MIRQISTAANKRNANEQYAKYSPSAFLFAERCICSLLTQNPLSLHTLSSDIKWVSGVLRHGSSQQKKWATHVTHFDSLGLIRPHKLITPTRPWTLARSYSSRHGFRVYRRASESSRSLSTPLFGRQSRHTSRTSRYMSGAQTRSLRPQHRQQLRTLVRSAITTCNTAIDDNKEAKNCAYDIK